MSESAENEEKWLDRWEKEGVFEPEPDKRESFYLTVAYPYPSGGMHIGHARTYTVPDVIARFKRMQGFNVLFPMAWHVTGTPIIGALRRLKEGEEKQLSVLRGVYSMTDEEMDSMEEPMDFARYFIDNHYRPSMRRLGYTIDWRRQFTTNDERYNKFITWQYMTLHGRGLVKKGLHPVKFCTKCENPVTTHDLLDGEDADVQEFTLIKFAWGDDYIMAATLRPETIYGQTNMWVNPDIEYVRAKVGQETWIVSAQCADKLKRQDTDIEVVGKVPGTDMIGGYCKAPGIERDIIILPSAFPDPDIGTGLVTSVPSDAPYDWIALMQLQDDAAMCERYGLDQQRIRDIKTIPIIDMEGYGPEAAKDVVEKLGIKSVADQGKLKEATQEVYKAGFHTGMMNDNCGPYSKMAVVRAKDKIKQWLLDEGRASEMLEFSEPVTCRCGGAVIVAKAESWFLDYANEDWKEQVRGAIHNMCAIPERTKQDYLNTVDWLRQWPCIRNFGLGTKLPFDDRFMIEPLSDSTIYMAYYTISHLLAELDADELKPEFFDLVFRRSGTIDDVSASTGIPAEKLSSIKESFEYWYPQNFRCSALELIQNHLTFMLYHHTAIFPGDMWPKGIASFGMGLLEGAKMSSSKGNVVLVKDAVDKYGADVVRLFLMGNAEPWMDFDWREKLVDATGKRLNQFARAIREAEGLEGRSERLPIDDWLISRLQGRIAEATESLDAFQTRKALQSIFYEMFKDLAWYNRRETPNPDVLREVAGVWVRLMGPFTPFICETLWEELGGEGFVSNAAYPVADESLHDDDAEAAEDYLTSLLEDIQNILQVMRGEAKSISLYVAEDWKHGVFAAIREGKAIKDVMADPAFRPHGKKVAKLMQMRADELPPAGLTPEKERELLSTMSAFLSREFGAEVSVDPADDPDGKRRFAMPGKPGIYIGR